MIDDNKALDIINTNESKIAEIIESKNHIELAKFIGQTYCNFTEDDLKYVDIFWEPTFNNSWIYASPEIVHEQLGYKKAKNMMTHFYEKLVQEYEANIDYKEVNKEHDLVKLYSRNLGSKKEARGASLKKYYIITGETYKALLASAQTKQGKITRKYFIKIESLASLTNQVMFRFLEYNNKKQLEEKDAQLRLKEEEYNRLHNINIDLLQFKKLSKRDESIYIVSTYDLARQGLFKVGKTKNIKTRSSGHNTTHPTGDKVKILAEFKVNDCNLMENTIHKKLEGLRPQKDSEFFLCPYDLLYDIIHLIIDYDHMENDSVNKLIDTVYKLKKKKFELEDWTSGLDLASFKEDILAITRNGEELKQFNVSTATSDEVKQFLDICIDAYNSTIGAASLGKPIEWKKFQPIIIQQLQIPKSQFKPTKWKDAIKKMDLAVVWRAVKAG